MAGEENKAIVRSWVTEAWNNGDFREDLPLAFIKKTIGYLFTHVTDLTDLSSTTDAEENLNYLISFMKTGLARDPQ